MTDGGRFLRISEKQVVNLDHIVRAEIQAPARVVVDFTDGEERTFSGDDAEFLINKIFGGKWEGWPSP